MVYNKSIQLILNKRSEKMATKPVLRRAIAGQKSKASDYNWNFDQMINYLDNSVVELENETETINQTKATTSLNNLTADGEARFDCKVNTDGSNLTNVSNVFKAKIVNWGIPDYDSRIDTGKQTPYTAPCDGLFVYSNNSTDSYMGSASVNGFLVSTLRAYTTDCFPVAKNDVIALAHTPQITTTYFVPMKGEINANV